MSGGSCNYICYKIEEELVGRMEDAELNDLMLDISKLAHALEWYLSSDTGKEKYDDAVRRFKNKWFKESRTDRLKMYIDSELDETREKLYSLLGVSEDDKT